MLPAAVRITRGQEFGLVVRRGRRVGRPRLVVHALVDPQGRGVSCPGGHTDAGGTAAQRPDTTGRTPVRVGFVVSKSVGNSVVRHRVTRRLRHLVRDRLGTLPGGCALVVRALPSAASASSTELGADLDGALRRLRLLPRDHGDAA